MKNTFLILAAMVLLGSCTKVEDPTANIEDPTGEMEEAILSDTYLRYENFPSKYVLPRNVEVWLPPKYDQMDSLPVLYMFDGQDIFHGHRSWLGNYDHGWQVDETLDSLANAGVVPEVMVVGIFHTGERRVSEYMPAKPEALVQQRMQEADPRFKKLFENKEISSNEQLRFIVEELKPFIDGNFKTRKDPANTFISGSSMGGLISAYAICEYPEVFGGAACISTHWPALDGVFVEYIKTNLPDPKTHKIYFDFGTEGLDGEYEPYQVVVDSLMEARGFEKEINWMTRKFEGHDHNSLGWRPRFHIPMTFLLAQK